MDMPEKYSHEVVLYCWNPDCMEILNIELNGKERSVSCPKCKHKEVYSQPHHDSFIQNNFERQLMKRIRKEMKRDSHDRYIVRKLICCIFKLR